MNNENMTSLFPIRKIALKPPLKAKEIREELAAYSWVEEEKSGKMIALKGGTFFKSFFALKFI